MEDIVYKLKDEVRGKGIDLLRDHFTTHNNLMVTCPEHGEGRESKPSCGISMVKQPKYPAGTVHCFTCGYTANIIEFISSVLGKQDGGIAGYKWLVSNFVYDTYSARRIEVEQPTRSKAKAEQKEVIGESELDSYRYTVQYMYQRGLTDEIIEKFDVGYDKEKEAITFPIVNLEGEVIAIQRRLIHTKQFLNVRGLKKDFIYGLWHVYQEIENVKEIVITESILDCLTAWKHGIPAVATLGAPSKAQLQLLRDLPVRTLVLAYDNDEAGEQFKKRVHQKIARKIIYEMVFPPGAKDLNDCDERFDSVYRKLYIR